MQDCFTAKTAQTTMAMYNLDLFSNHDIAEYGEKGEERRHRSFTIDDEERDVVHFKTVCEVSHSSATLVCMSDDDDLVAAVNEFLCNWSLDGHSFNSRQQKVTVDN